MTSPTATATPISKKEPQGPLTCLGSDNLLHVIGDGLRSARGVGCSESQSTNWDRSWAWAAEPAARADRPHQRRASEQVSVGLRPTKCPHQTTASRATTSNARPSAFIAHSFRDCGWACRRPSAVVDPGQAPSGGKHTTLWTRRQSRQALQRMLHIIPEVKAVGPRGAHARNPLVTGGVYSRYQYGETYRAGLNTKRTEWPPDPGSSPQSRQRSLAVLLGCSISTSSPEWVTVGGHILQPIAVAPENARKRHASLCGWELASCRLMEVQTRFLRERSPTTSQTGEPEVNYTVDEGEGRLTVRQQCGPDFTAQRCLQCLEDLLLTDALPISLRIQCGAGEQDIDLVGLNITDLDVRAQGQAIRLSVSATLQRSAGSTWT